MEITEHAVRTARHGTFYLASGPADGPLLIFVHGWPALSLMWRRQLEFFGDLGYRCVAPDMRGYGRSDAPAEHDAYALALIVDDMIELLDALGADRAVWIGHDLGSPIVWSLGGHHPERCRGVVSLCVPYLASGFAPDTLIPLVDRTVYPAEKYPAGQWDYQLFYQQDFDGARAAFEADLPATFKALFRSGSTELGQPSPTARVTRDGGWFGGTGRAPDVPRDPAVLAQDDLDAYVAAFERAGFNGPDAWYVNNERNLCYAASASDGGTLRLPVLFLHARFDAVCESVRSRLAEPMRRDCADLTERIVDAGHWMPLERAGHVNAEIETWLRAREFDRT